MLGAKPTVGLGHVSSSAGINDNPARMQITMPLQRGNGGGQVFDQAGQVIGVVASKLDALKIAESVGDLPQNVDFTLRGEATREFLGMHRVTYGSTRDNAWLDNTGLAVHKVAVTARVRCARQELNRNNDLHKPRGIKKLARRFHRARSGNACRA